MVAPQLSEVWMTGEDGEKIIVSESDEMEKHILNRNRSQLLQAANTPFADGEWGEMIKWDGTGDMADRIVQGQPLHETAHKSQLIQTYIEGMAASDPSILNTVDTNITFDQYTDFWKGKR